MQRLFFLYIQRLLLSRVMNFYKLFMEMKTVFQQPISIGHYISAVAKMSKESTDFFLTVFLAFAQFVKKQNFLKYKFTLSGFLREDVTSTTL